MTLTRLQRDSRVKLDNLLIPYLSGIYKNDVTRGRHSLIAIAMKLIYIVFTLVALVSAETPDVPNNILPEDLRTYVNVRKALEDLIPWLSQRIIENNLDPYSLDNIQREFWVPFPGIPLISYKANLILHSGELKGLSQLRFTDATLTYENRMITLAIDTEFPLFAIAYKYDLKLRILHPEGMATADAKQVRASTIVSFNTTDYMLTLDKFRLQPFDFENVIIQDKTGWRHFVLSLIADIFATLNKNKIAQTLETRVTEIIGQYVSEINRNTSPEMKFRFFQDILFGHY
ncbi:uncharacterized protein LOC105184545 [Harpegnathos saltator]|uniref:uncharacterized protein LOC105184545 n=1 Tax=Harpegnathos saltator TaxID=610380 RepID=UPI000948CA30|nr:uncharacterized protein LOC105184545 [Harpegnathos saltator]